MQTEQEVLAEDLKDPEFAAVWQASALARAVAAEVVRYRRSHELSQAALAGRLGMRQPQVARIETGDVTPTIETLVRLSTALDLEFAIGVRPVGRPDALLRVTPRDAVEANGAVVTVVATPAGSRKTKAAPGKTLAESAPAEASVIGLRQSGKLVAARGTYRRVALKSADTKARKAATAPRRSPHSR